MYFNNNSVKVSRQFFFLRVSTSLIGCCFFKLLIKRAYIRKSISITNNNL